MKLVRNFYEFGPPATVPVFGGSVFMRISETAQKCVVFFGVPDGAGGIKYGGTGFLVLYPSAEFHEPFAYLVTAGHVAKSLEKKWGDEGFYLRINTTDGGSVSPHLVVQEWH